MVDRYKPASYVGYGRPPIHARFKKGISGNPGGRPKREVDPPNLFFNELMSSVTITENGQLVRTDKMTLLFRQTINHAIKSGNLRYIVDAMKIMDGINQMAVTHNKARSMKELPDFSKMSLDEKMKKMKEIIANSRSRDEFF